MNTITVLSGLGQTPYAIVAAQRARFSSQARQRANVGYNIRNWRRISGGDTSRQRIMAAQLRMARERRAQPVEPPDPTKMAADRRRREEASRMASARLSRMLDPRFRPGAGQRSFVRTEGGRRLMTAWKQPGEAERIRQSARARSRMAAERRRQIAETQAAERRRSMERVITPPPIETIPVIQIPDRASVTITTREVPEMLDIARKEPAIGLRQSTEALQRLVDARRALGMR